MATLRSKLIRLAHTSPKLRRDLLPLLKKASDPWDDVADRLQSLSIGAFSVLEYVDHYGPKFRSGLDRLLELSNYSSVTSNEVDRMDADQLRTYFGDVLRDLDKALNIFKSNTDQTSGKVPTAYSGAVSSLRREILSLLGSLPKATSLTPIISAETNFKRELTSFSGSVAKYLMLLKGVEDPKIRKEVDNVLKVKKAMEDAVSDLSFAIGNYVTKNATGK